MTTKMPGARPRGSARRWLSGLLAAGILAAVVAITAAGTAPTCLQMLEELDRRMLGSAPPADPEALRERDAAYEAAVAALCPPASPRPVPAEADVPYVPETGIFEPAEDVLARYDFANYWVGRVGGTYVTVYAGIQDAEPQQGGVWVFRDGEPVGGFLPIPAAAGGVRIVAADGALLTLRAADGSTFTFDAARLAYR